MLGHQKQWQFFKKSAEMGKIPHGLLFYGQEQVGKKTFAIEFAKFLNCQLDDNSKKPCQKCKNCLDIGRKSYPDLIFVEPQSLNGEIQISQIRELARSLSLKSYSSRFKVAILDKAHSMNQEAQSCFLKLLEEPRGETILILISEYPEILLPTILSRVQKIRFSPLGNREIENSLLERGIPEEKARYLTSLSFGKPGMIDDFLQDVSKVDSQKKIIEDAVKISKSDLAARFQYAKNLCGENPDNPAAKLKEVLEIWLKFFRKIFLLHLADSKEKAEEQVPKQYPISKLVKIIRTIQSTNFLLSTTNANPKLALEILLMEL